MQPEVQIQTLASYLCNICCVFVLNPPCIGASHFKTPSIFCPVTPAPRSRAAAADPSCCLEVMAGYILDMWPVQAGPHMDKQPALTPRANARPAH